ncbi:hypothetical protein [Candidatus Deferrimicrobium sp.]|uniref:hypothetical protein n=1 Tax=Candidatus Deferrimicrobium sp. TaxID=3060586 RepID=UPI002ED6B0F1
MRTSNMQARIFGSTVGKIVMALVCASMIGGTFISQAFGEDHDRREGYREGYNERGRFEHGRYEHGRYKKSRRVYHSPPRYYPAPVYAPPPVVYAPAPYQSPGISIVFPIDIR